MGDLEDLLETLCISVGSALILDDKEDFGKFNRIHHWQIGVTLIAIPFVKRILDDFNA